MPATTRYTFANMGWQWGAWSCLNNSGSDTTTTNNIVNNYVRRGYVPDGRGLWDGNRWLQWGDTTRVDDDLVLYLTKRLSPFA